MQSFADDAHVVKNYLLLEMPGYPIDPDIFDEEEFKQNPKAMSPQHYLLIEFLLLHAISMTQALKFLFTGSNCCRRTPS